MSRQAIVYKQVRKALPYTVIDVGDKAAITKVMGEFRAQAEQNTKEAYNRHRNNAIDIIMAVPLEGEGATIKFPSISYSERIAEAIIATFRCVRRFINCKVLRAHSFIIVERLTETYKTCVICRKTKH